MTGETGQKRRSRTATFTTPTLIALFSLIGLIAALAGDGLFDWLSWFALATPVIAVAWAIAMRRC